MVRTLALTATLAACGRVSFDPVTDANESADDAGRLELAQISAGGHNTCAVLGTGEVYCWGVGAGGATGDGDGATHVARPHRVDAPPVHGIDVNDDGAVVWFADGMAMAWGPNVAGKFGSAATHVTPTLLPVTRVRSASHMREATCLVLDDATVQCAGDSAGLGDGSTVGRAAFAPVPMLADVTALSAGDDHVCALLAAGSVRCWGINDRGQIGNGTSNTIDLMPAPGPVGPYIAIASGDEFVCGLRGGGGVDCWGANSEGQLGDGTFVERHTPVAVVDLDDAVAIVAGSSSACALRRTREVVCWGANEFGTIAEQGSIRERAAPGGTVLSDVIAISARTSKHVCALTRDRSMWCWGDNSEGQLGTPLPSIAYTPVRVTVF